MKLNSLHSSASSNTPTALAEINVTPLVDVMLVLLIVFMITAPLMQQGITVDLPKANAQSLSLAPSQVILVINKSKQILLNGNALDPGTLRSRLEAMSAAKSDIEVIIQADQAISYGFVAQVMAEVKRAKINRVGLVTELADPGFKL
mgnify:CR=1 FL=1